MVCVSELTVLSPLILCDNRIASRNVCRIVVAAIIPICAGVFHTNPFFRFYCSFAFPLLALVDMLSEVDLMGYIHCVDSGACVNASSRDASYLWLWRDLVGITINICGTALAWYVKGMTGYSEAEVSACFGAYLRPGIAS